MTTGLTGREVEVLELLTEGLTNQQLADRLGISPRTVQHHLEHLAVKLETGSRAGMVGAGFRSGVLS